MEGKLHFRVYSIDFTQIGWETIYATMKKHAHFRINPLSDRANHNLNRSKTTLKQHLSINRSLNKDLKR